MINPTITKRIKVLVSNDRKTGIYRGVTYDINDFKYPAPNPGIRIMTIKYSIINERYYLTTK